MTKPLPSAEYVAGLFGKYKIRPARFTIVDDGPKNVCGCAVTVLAIDSGMESCKISRETILDVYNIVETTFDIDSFCIALGFDGRPMPSRYDEREREAYELGRKVYEIVSRDFTTTH